MDALESELGRRAESMRSHESRIAELTEENELLRGELAAGRAAADGLRAEIASVRADAAEEMRVMAVFARQLEELRINSRGTATRIRLQALREAAEVNARLLDATDPRTADVRDRILDKLEQAIDRVAAQWDAGAGAAPPAPPLGRSAAARVSLAGGQLAGSQRRVSVDIGPFADFSQLVRFEDAANSIGATGDISITRFSGGRARIDMALSEPVDLLRELEDRCDLEFRVRSRSDDEIVLDVDG